MYSNDSDGSAYVMTLDGNSIVQEEREPKRARQACENCRRKKTRCSGERPVCEFCKRLGQTCIYNGRVTTTAQQASPTPLSQSSSLLLVQSHAELAARLALIESRLGLGDQSIGQGDTSDNESIRSPRRDPQQSASDGTGSIHSPSIVGPVDETSKFTTVPPQEVLQSLVDVYFKSCHNQPYCFFLESTFRQRLANHALPDHLLMAFSATAVRYSDHSFFGGRQQEALGTYARTAWHIILKQAFSSEQGLDLNAVQATNLLAAVDFTAGQHRLGWVKIGLAIRFAQGLRLNVEPDSTMDASEQEEHRRAFWSVYILDKFVSCCRGRPPSILDVDCTVVLPTNEQHAHNELATKSPTLALMRDLPDISTCRSLSHFSLLILAASTLGRVVRYNLPQNTTKSYPPWDFRSDFAKVSSILLSLEPVLSIGDIDLETYISTQPDPPQGYDKPWKGHFIYSRGVYHMSCCLLYHPLFLHRHLQHYRESFPRSFVRTSLRHCQEHAEHLTKILRVVLDTKCCARGSFLGYLAVVAGSIHRLYEHSIDPIEQTRAQQLSQDCLEFLQRGPVVWGNYPRMATALSEYQIDQNQALALIGPHFPNQDLENMRIETLSCILDYGWLSDAHRSDRPTLAKTPQPMEQNSWRFFEDLFAGGIDHSSDPVGQSLNTFMHGNGGSGSGNGRGWWAGEIDEDAESGNQILDFTL